MVVGGGDIAVDPAHHNISKTSDSRNARPRAFPSADRINPAEAACFTCAALANS